MIDRDEEFHGRMVELISRHAQCARLERESAAARVAAQQKLSHKERAKSGQVPTPKRQHLKDRELWSEDGTPRSVESILTQARRASEGLPPREAAEELNARRAEVLRKRRVDRIAAPQQVGVEKRLLDEEAGKDWCRGDRWTDDQLAKLTDMVIKLVDIMPTQIWDEYQAPQSPAEPSV